eukprot:UN28837
MGEFDYLGSSEFRPRKMSAYTYNDRPFDEHFLNGGGEEDSDDFIDLDITSEKGKRRSVSEYLIKLIIMIPLTSYWKNIENH